MVSVVGEIRTTRREFYDYVAKYTDEIFSELMEKYGEWSTLLHKNGQLLGRDLDQVAAGVREHGDRDRCVP